MRARSSRRGRTLVLVTSVCFATTLVAGCTPSGEAKNAPAASVSPSPAAEIEIVPDDGTGKVRLDKQIAINATNGTLTTVTVSSKSTTLKGELAEDKTSWLSTGSLKPATKYTIDVAAANQDGRTTESSTTFKTLAPKSTATAWTQPSTGSTVGVGMPVVVNFSTDVSESRRDEVEDAMSVTSKPEVKGAWRWVNSQQAQWRPKEYWPSDTEVEVRAKLKNVELAKGVWGEATAKSDFTVGSSMISTVDMDKHTLTVRRGGKVLRTIPITTGKSGYETRNGIKVIMTRETTRRMDAASTGTDPKDPDYYNIVVQYAMRLTYSGEFLHAAPWSVGSQGRANVSHGCTGMSTSNAKWMFDHSKIGDVVKYVGSSRALEDGNGWTAWDMSYKKWSA